jgi:hypothetical protein
VRIAGCGHTLSAFVLVDHNIVLSTTGRATSCVSRRADAALDCLHQLLTLPDWPVAACTANGLDLLEQSALVPVEPHLGDLAVRVEVDNVDEREGDNALVDYVLVHAGEECAASIVELQGDLGLEANAIVAFKGEEDLLVLLDDLLLLDLQVLDDSGGFVDGCGRCDVVYRSVRR